MACSDPGVYDVHFGRFVKHGERHAFEATTEVICHEKETPIGWFFKLRDPPDFLTVREEIEGPPGTVWNFPPETSAELADNGRTVKLTRVFTRPGDQLMFHLWALDRDDPAGQYKVALYLQGKRVREVEFRLHHPENAELHKREGGRHLLLNRPL